MPATRHILGISAFYHDAAAAMLRDGVIVAAAQEERFSRRKNDPGFPGRAIGYCLRESAISAAELDAVVFYDKPILKFARMLETWRAVAPGGWRTFTGIVPDWLGEKLDLRKTIHEELPQLRPECPILFTQHHQSHAASAFYPSPFDTAAILTVDGVGEWATTAIGRGHGAEIELLKEIRFPHSLGLLYSAFTDYCGFAINSGEYKLMGLAPFGEPKFLKPIYDELIELKADGSFRLNLEYFNFLRGTTMTAGKFHDLFGGPPRQSGEPLLRRHADVARSVQAVTEEVMLRLARHAAEVTGLDQLCLAGGVALNCVANGRIFRECKFKNLWIQPAAGDAGGALGAALAAWHQHFQQPRRAYAGGDSMSASMLGPAFDRSSIREFLDARRARFHELDQTALVARVADLLAEEKVVGWFQGRMEYGPRALGARSILGDARSARMQSVLNRKIKFRESFRPFAPCVLREHAHEWFDVPTGVDSPYMLLVAPVLEKHRLPAAEAPGGPRGEESGLFDSFNAARSTIPAVTHVDFSARIQTVDERHGLLRALLEEFHRKSGCPVLVNTSFNLSWEPIVCEPGQAYHTFMQSDMDALVLENILVLKSEQPRGFPSLEDAAAHAAPDNQNPWADPATGQPLTVTKQALLNPATGARYPVDHGVPCVLLVENPGGHGNVTQTVRQFYEETPFPDYGAMDSVRGLMDKARRRILGRMLNDQIPYDARVLEIGCGTGQLTNFLAVSGRSVVGTDLSWSSLMQAQRFKEVHGIRHAAFAQMNLFRPAVRDGFFDVVICNGVLHHTADPKAGFGRICRLLKPGGYIVVGLYNRYSRALHYFRRALRFWTGLGGGWLDPQLGADMPPNKREAWFKDQYTHPHESCHSLSEVMGWLEEFGLEFVNAVPKPAGGPGLADEERLFERKNPGTALTRAVSQWHSLPDGCREGGFFIVIARRA